MRLNDRIRDDTQNHHYIPVARFRLGVSGDDAVMMAVYRPAGRCPRGVLFLQIA
jgi:hypothetical protein